MKTPDCILWSEGVECPSCQYYAVCEMIPADTKSYYFRHGKLDKEGDPIK